MKNIFSHVSILVEIIFVFLIGIFLVAKFGSEMTHKNIVDMTEREFAIKAPLIADDIIEITKLAFDSSVPQISDFENTIQKYTDLAASSYKAEVRPISDSKRPDEFSYVEPLSPFHDSYVLTVIFSRPDVEKMVDSIQAGEEVFRWTGLGILAVVMMGVLSFLLNSVGRVSHVIQRLADGNLNVKVKIEHNCIEANRLSRAIQTLQQNLRTLISRESAAKLITERRGIELDIAHNIQKDLMVKDFKIFEDRPKFETHAELINCRDVGGDFYDIFKLDSAHAYLGVGDAVATGISATFTMVIAKTMMRNLISRYRHTGQAISAVSEALIQQNTKEPISLFSAILNIHTGELRWANAGTIIAWIYRAETQTFEPLADSSTFAGLKKDMVYHERKCRLSRHDMLIVLTDGFEKIINVKRNTLGIENLQMYMRQYIEMPPSAFIKGVLKNIYHFAKNIEFPDDLTLTAMKSGYIIEKYPDVPPEGFAEITIPNQLTELPKINEWAEAFNTAHEVPMPLSMSFALAMEEWFVNIVSYAYTDKKEHMIQVYTWVADEGLWLRIEDDGIPYDPTVRDEVNISIPLEQRGIGGLGIHFIRQTMDIFVYERKNNKNVVTLMKRLDSLS